MKKTIGSIVGLGSLLIASQALATWNADVPALDRTSFSSSCQIGDVIIAAGGYDIGGTATDAVFKYDPSVPQWVPVTDMNVARGEFELIEIEGTDKCLAIGGRGIVGGASLASAEVYDVSADTWTATANNPAARAAFKASPCGTNVGINTNAGDSANVVAIGGDNAGAITSIQVYNAFSNSFANLTNLNTGRSLFGLGDDQQNHVRFVIAGGDQSSAPVRTVETLQVDADCGSPDIDLVTLDNGVAATNVLSNFRSMNETFWDGTTASKFVVAGGSPDNLSCLSTADVLTVTNWASNPPVIDRDAATVSIGDQRCRPLLVEMRAVDDYMLIGGFDSNGLSVDTSILFPALTTESLIDARYGGIGEFIASEAKVFTSLGIKRTVFGPTIILEETENN